MNKITLVGNLVKDNETFKLTKNNSIMCINTLAVKRKFNDKDGNKITDFFNFTTFGKQAEYLNNYTSKGDKIIIHGECQIIQNTKDDKKYTNVHIYVTDVEFLSHPQNIKEKDNLTVKAIRIRKEDK